MLILTGIIGLMLASAAFVGLAGASDTDDTAETDGQPDTGLDAPMGNAATAGSGLSDIMDAAERPPLPDDSDETDRILAGQSGPDLIAGGAGDDQIGGRQGNDTLMGAEGRDDLHGAEGDDLVIGGPGNDHLYGGTGDDSLSGGPGHDSLFGGAGHDILIGHRPEDAEQSDADYLNGADGDDTILSGSGDIATGGRGADLFQLGHWIRDPVEVVDFDPTEDRLIIIFDDSSADPPLIELRDDDGGSGQVNLYLDGAHVASLSGANGLMLSDIAILGQSQAT